MKKKDGSPKWWNKTDEDSLCPNTPAAEVMSGTAVFKEMRLRRLL